MPLGGGCCYIVCITCDGRYAEINLQYANHFSKCVTDTIGALDPDVILLLLTVLRFAEAEAEPWFLQTPATFHFTADSLSLYSFHSIFSLVVFSFPADFHRRAKLNTTEEHSF